MNKIYFEECLAGMDKIQSAEVDMILCDLPYGTLSCEWDKLIDLKELFKQYRRVIKPNGNIVLTSQQPFTTDLINVGRDIFRYEIIWEKTQKMGFLDANRKPLRGHENILVFYKKRGVYNPQKYVIEGTMQNRVRYRNENSYEGYGNFGATTYVPDGTRYPHSVIKISNWNGTLFGDTSNNTKHPTQKPVPLFEWLIKSYSNEGDLILDNCMGSGTTAIACLMTNRKFIGFENYEEYYQLANQRITDFIKPEPPQPKIEFKTIAQPTLF